MTNEEILKKAIEKAVKGGYNFKLAKEITDQIDYIEAKNIAVASPDTDLVKSMYGVIFSHDFAKAIWGSGPVCSFCFKGPSSKHELFHDWQYHLREMVLEEDKLKYIEKYL